MEVEVRMPVSADKFMRLTPEQFEAVNRCISTTDTSRLTWLPGPRFRTTHVLAGFWRWRQSGDLPDAGPETARLFRRLRKVLRGAAVKTMSARERAQHRQTQAALDELRRRSADWPS